jgi:indole-3-glycerol phosphate synthase
MKPMRNILDEIAERTRERVAVKKKEVPVEEIAEAALKRAASGCFTTVKAAPPLYCRNTCHVQIRRNSESNNVPAFETALRSNDIAFICEIKRASPSKGLIAEDFPYLDIARDYEAAGAAAISVLTEPYYFKGGDRYLREIAKTVKLPLLSKDFTVD